MEQKIKVYINSKSHSAGRGVGYYTQFLSESLTKLPEIELTSKDPDIIHYPFFDLFYPTLPFKKEKPTLVTIHDLTPLVMPKRYPKGVRGSITVLRQWLSLSNVNAIITDSQNSKEDICKIFKINQERVFVTPLAVDPIFFHPLTNAQLVKIRQKYHLPNKFVLNVPGGPNPNKNLPALAEVTSRLNIPLVIVGKGMLQEIKIPVHPELKDLEALKNYEHIIYPGFVPTEELVGLYQLATLYCQPSLYEGFGLPLLEAMSVGCLIVSSNTSSLPEIYYPEAITFDPSDQKSMEKAISLALSLPSKEEARHRTLAKDRSREFSWEKTSKETSAIYQKIYDHKRDH